MPHAMSMPSTGLQALILCGPGSSFPTFTSNPDESPKALLPIANRPMVWYPIDFCHRMGITGKSCGQAATSPWDLLGTPVMLPMIFLLGKAARESAFLLHQPNRCVIDITLICPPSASNAMNSAFSINPSLTSLPLPKPDIVSPKDLDFNTGTAKILCLAEVRDLVKLDFVVLPCDLVCELGGDKLLQAWMIKAASLAHLVGHGGFADGHGTRHSGGLGVWYNTKTAVPVKGEETDFIATAPLPPSQPDALKGPVLSNLSRLVYSMPTDSLNDLMEEKKSLPIRHGLLRAHPRLRMYTAHRDAHIYIFPRWIMDFINVNQRLDSIGEDVVGWWAKAGWQAGLADKLHITSLCSTRNPDDDQDSIPDSVSSHASCAEHSAAGPSDEAPAGPEPFGQGDGRRQNDSGHSWHATDVPPILAYLHSSEGQANAPILRRVDNAQLLLATSLQLAKLESVEEVVSAFKSGIRLSYERSFS